MGLRSDGRTLLHQTVRRLHLYQPERAQTQANTHHRRSSEAFRASETSLAVCSSLQMVPLQAKSHLIFVDAFSTQPFTLDHCFAIII